MAQSAAPSFAPLAAKETLPRQKPDTACLDAVDLHTPVRVVSLALEEDLLAWLRAVGIAEGDELTVLRRAVFGGPLHVRTGAGGEFALHRSLARAIVIRRVDMGA
jgi:ferrous iron transport protein A